MGKTGGSWLTAVKRVFRSPPKDDTNDTRRSTRPRHHIDQPQQEQQHNKKKGWLFRKPANHEATHQTITQNAVNDNISNSVSQEEQQRHAIAVAIATARAAEAAVATAQAAVEVARLTGPPPSYYTREHYAATVVQTAFRGYLARRALRALKGVVKLQALVRGHNVRSQAKMTLRCMQALVRVQSRVLNQRARQSNDSSSQKSTFSGTNSLWDSNHLQDTYDRKSTSRDGSSIAEEWDERAHTVEEVKAMLQHRKDSAALRREKNLSQAFSQQMWRSNRNKSFGNEEELGLKEHIQSKRRASTDRNDSFFKTVEIDNTSNPQVFSSYLPPTNKRPNQHHQRSNSQCPPSPLNRPQNSPRHHTPPLSKPILAQARSASPRYNRPQTPSVRSNYFYNGPMTLNGLVPNYMVETESVRARIRAHSAPRQRPATPERDGEVGSVAKKRLSYNSGFQNKSPSFKSMSGVMQMGVEQQSTYSSCYTDSLGGEISPSSTTDLRR